MHLYNKLLEKIDYLEPNQIKQIHQAYLIAKNAHFGQKRDNGEVYITHPVAVAEILAQMHTDHQSIVAALLHDVIEDTSVTKDKIINTFDKTIAELVDGVTKITKIEASNKAENQAASFRKMLLAMSQDIRIILIKLADRLHNMRTINLAALHKRRRIAKETLDIYAPIANRLSMHNICIELENLAFATIYPRRHRVLKKAMTQAQNNLKELMNIIEQALNKVFDRNRAIIKEVKITGRKKHLYSTYRKMLENHTSFTNIMDVHAFRIVVNTIDDCYRALGIIHSLYKPIPGKFKDYIAIPKYNGYQSLHTILLGPHGNPIEIQIRTQAMDQIANNGIAAHWLYKCDEKAFSATQVRTQQWVNNLLEMQKTTSNSLEFLENVKINLFPDDVYVFTPKGDIMELPTGATAVDFAYAVHTHIGNTCTAVLINHQLAPLSTSLATGQIVSIITSKNAKPNPAWLNFIVTSKARGKIRNYLKNQKLNESVALGRQLFIKAFDDLQFDFQRISLTSFNNLLKELNLKKTDELYENIGLGKQLAIFVAHKLININEPKFNEIKNKNLQDIQDKNNPLLICGAEGLTINFSSCCSPIPGDEIIGFFNEGHGLDIHTKHCTVFAKLRKHLEKCLPVKWADNISGSFKVSLVIEIFKQRGVLAEITESIAKANAIIDDINMRSVKNENNNYCLISLTILVKNLPHLKRVLRHIAKNQAVVNVERKK